MDGPPLGPLVDVGRAAVPAVTGPWDEGAYLATQAMRLAPLRSHLLRRAHIGRTERVLEIGCGAGEITSELRRRSPGLLVAIDRDPDRARQTAARVPGAEALGGQGEHLPFASSTFDCVAFAYVLLWARCPAAVVREAARVVRPGGRVIALAEPDYGAYWEEPPLIGDLLLQGFRSLGANPTIGADLCELFGKAGLLCECGSVHPPGNDVGGLEEDDDISMLHATLSTGVSAETARFAMGRVADARARGDRRAFVPIRHAIGTRRQ